MKSAVKMMTWVHPAQKTVIEPLSFPHLREEMNLVASL